MLQCTDIFELLSEEAGDLMPDRFAKNDCIDEHHDTLDRAPLEYLATDLLGLHCNSAHF